MKRLVVIADWARDAVYCREYKSAILGFVKEDESIDISFIPVSSSPIHTGFILKQLVYTEERLGRPLNTVIHLASEPKGSPNEFLVIKLQSGLYVYGINHQYNFTFVKRDVDEAFLYKLPETTANFLSRDIYSRVAADLLQSLQDDLELEQVHLNTISELEGSYIGHIDGFGNIITTITYEAIKGKYNDGDEIVVKINSVSKQVVYKNDLWLGNKGQLVFGPSSFGPADNPYLALVFKNESASVYFGRISPGDKVIF